MERSKNPAVRYGLIFGGIIAVLSVLNAVLSPSDRFDTTGSPGAVGGGLGCLFALASIALLVAPGWLTARATGRTGSGAVSGLIAGLIGSLVFAVALIILVQTLSAADYADIAKSSQQQLTPDQARRVVTIAIVFASVVIVLFAVGVGAGLGAIGGLIGKSQFNGPANPYQQSFYQGQPPAYPGQQPMYPGQPPTYPGQPGQQPGYPPPPPPGYPQTSGYPQPGAYPPPGSYTQQPGTNPPPAGSPQQDDSQTRPPQYPNS